MTHTERKHILEQVKEWFRTVIVPNHLQNTEKLVDPSKLKINPFIVPYQPVGHDVKSSDFPGKPEEFVPDFIKITFRLS